MLSYAASLSPNNEAFAVFVSDNDSYSNIKGFLKPTVVKKIDNFLKILKTQKVEKKEQISSFDISDSQKCFIIRIKNKYENNYPE